MGAVLTFTAWATGGFTLVLWIGFAIQLASGRGQRHFETYWTNSQLLRLASTVISFAMTSLMYAGHVTGVGQGSVLKGVAFVIGGLTGLAAPKFAPLIPWPKVSPFQAAMGLVLTGCAYMALLLALSIKTP